MNTNPSFALTLQQAKNIQALQCQCHDNLRTRRTSTRKKNYYMRTTTYYYSKQFQKNLNQFKKRDKKRQPRAANRWGRGKKVGSRDGELHFNTMRVRLGEPIIKLWEGRRDVANKYLFQQGVGVHGRTREDWKYADEGKFAL